MGMTNTETVQIPAVGNLITFMDAATWLDHAGEVIEVQDASWADLSGAMRRHVSLTVLDRITGKLVRLGLGGVVSDLGPLKI